MKNKVYMSVFEKHQINIARKTLNMPDGIVGVMGGMTKKEAKEFIEKMKDEHKIFD